MNNRDWILATGSKFTYSKLLLFIMGKSVIISYSIQFYWLWFLIKLISLFQALCQCGRLKKRVGDERGLVGKKGKSGEPVSIVLKTSFRYTSSWYTLWLVTFDSLYQHLVCLSEAKWRLTWRAWYTRAISTSQNLLKRSEWSKERVWSIWPVDRCFRHYSHRFREKFAIFFRGHRSDGFRCYLHVASQSLTPL